VHTTQYFSFPLHSKPANFWINIRLIKLRLHEKKNIKHLEKNVSLHENIFATVLDVVTLKILENQSWDGI